MITQIINYIFLTNIVLSLLVFFDVLIKFKHPLILKLMLLLITITIAWYAIIYYFHIGYNRWISEMPHVLMLAGCLNFLSIIYSHKIKNRVLFFTTSLILIQIFFLFYFSYISPIDQHIQLKDIKEMILFRMAIKVISLIITLVIAIELYIKIFKKYSSNNLYLKKVMKWSSMIIITFSLCMTVFILKTIFKNLETLFVLVKGISNLIVLLFALYRPVFLNNTHLKISLSDTFNFKGMDEFDPRVFIEHFTIHLYYLNTEANITELAEKLGTNEVFLSEYIKEKHGFTFSELVNKHRVDYFASLVNSGRYKDYTVEALATMSGFSSRQNLYRYFKKFHGGNPTDLLKAVVK